MPNTKEKINKIKKEVAKMDWCKLAHEIIELESFTKDTSRKDLKSLELKLKICEEEKASRVFDRFNLQYFLNKDYEYIDMDTF